MIPQMTASLWITESSFRVPSSSKSLTEIISSVKFEDISVKYSSAVISLVMPSGLERSETAFCERFFLNSDAAGTCSLSKASQGGIICLYSSDLGRSTKPVCPENALFVFGLNVLMYAIKMFFIAVPLNITKSFFQIHMEKAFCFFQSPCSARVASAKSNKINSRAAHVIVIITGNYCNVNIC